jgi:hypothetical protein
MNRNSPSPRHRPARLAILGALAVLAGCAAVEPPAKLADDERYYCRPGSMLKYRKPLAAAFPGYWVPMPPGGSCKGY